MTTQPAVARVLAKFEAISAIPRRSKEEDRIIDWLLAWAAERSLTARTDAVRNIVIEVPASAGFESAPTVVLQGHVDMVCEKTPESPHDFSTDPIRLLREGDWLTADGTTLGADNGIALAMALALAEDPEAGHPALELLFTVDEETGLTGANAVQPGFVSGKVLINLDSEDEGVLTVGCAGGVDTLLTLDLPHEGAPAAGFVARTLVAGGMAGGHSGVDIHLMRANALRVLVRALEGLLPHGVRPFDPSGGSAHNAIPRDARVGLLVPSGALAAVEAAVAEASRVMAAEFLRTDPHLALKLAPAAAPPRVMTLAGARTLIDFVLAVPHGVAAMATDIAGLVETSNNEATLKMDGETLILKTSQRSSVMSRLRAHTARIEGLARLAGGRARSGGGYPAWQPNMDSELLARCSRLYRELFGKDPVVEVIHAGLECGIIGAKNEGMDMISIGPTIKFPHSPDERLLVPTVGQVWEFLLAILASYRG